MMCVYGVCVKMFQLEQQQQENPGYDLDGKKLVDFQIMIKKGKFSRKLFFSKMKIKRNFMEIFFFLVERLSMFTTHFRRNFYEFFFVLFVGRIPCFTFNQFYKSR